MRSAPLIAAGLLTLLATSSARANPYYAQREGYRCSKCHVNGTGGGMRTAFGRQWAWTHLTVVDPPREPATPTGSEGTGETGEGAAQRVWWAIDPVLNDHITVGADLRAEYQASLADDIQNTFRQPEANLYVALDALQYFTAYVDTAVAEGTVEAREAFLMLHRLGGFRVKAGILLLPYGLRVWGDDEFIRSETGFTFADSDLGIELGYELGGLGAFVAVSNGAGGGLDADGDKKVSGTVEYAGRWWRIGGSGSFNRTSRQEDVFVGGHAGLTFGRLALLGEADLLRSTVLVDDEPDPTFEGLALYGEASFLVVRGLALRVAYGFHDPSLEVEENERLHLRAGIEVFPVPMVAATAYYDLRESVPQDEVGNADVIAVEFHLYL